jgi:hypothetical protein
VSSPLPGPSRRTATAPPQVGDSGSTTGVLLKTETSLDVTAKASIFDPFNNLNDWVTVYGEPVITSGNLAGEGVVRHKTAALTDSHKVTAVVGSKDYGRTRLYCCADSGLKTYYAVEVHSNVVLGDKVHFIKGIPASSVESAPGLLGILTSILSLLFGLLSIFSSNVTPYATKTSITIQVGDEIGIWYDEPNTTVRIYHDAEEILTVPVPRGEIPHGENYRYHGAAVGLELQILNLGARMSSYTCEDV